MGDGDRVAVVGAGDMGHGLAVHLAAHGRAVSLVDHRESNLDDAAGRMVDAADFLASHDRLDDAPDAVLDRVEATTDLGAGVGDAALVLESITEDAAAKRDLFGRLADAAPADAVLASNTSGIPITEIAQGAPAAAERVVGCHWWYPPYLLRPVEVVRGEDTADATVERVDAFLSAVDRDPVHVERDVPGFVWNRVQFAVMRECLHMLDEGVASAADINRAVRDGYALRTAAIGPFETMDIAGLELFGTLSADLFPALSDADEPPALLADAVADGRTGVDAGAGIFDYDEDAATVTGRRDELVAAIQDALDAGRADADGSQP